MTSCFQPSLRDTSLLFYRRIPSYRVNREFLFGHLTTKDSQGSSHLLLYCTILSFPLGKPVPWVLWPLLTSRDKLYSVMVHRIHHLHHASARPPRIRALSFHLIPTSFTPTVPNSYGTLICLAILSTVICLIWSCCSLGQMFVLGFRFHLAMDTLAFDYAIPAIRACSGLSPVRQCSCRAYQYEANTWKSDACLYLFICYYVLILNLVLRQFRW